MFFFLISLPSLLSNSSSEGSNVQKIVYGDLDIISNSSLQHFLTICFLFCFLGSGNFVQEVRRGGQHDGREQQIIIRT